MKDLGTILKESSFLTAKTSAMVCWLFVGSGIFSAAFALLGGQELIEKWVLSLDMTPVQFMILAQFIIFILGWPLEWTEIIIIFMPIFLPLLPHFGIDPLFFGLLVALNLQTAFLSPPVAMAAFYLKGVSPPHVTLNQIFAGMMPFMGIQLIALVLLYIFPQIGLWLPQHRRMAPVSSPRARSPPREAAQRIREGLLTSEELVEACLERIRQRSSRTCRPGPSSTRSTRSRRRAPPTSSKRSGEPIGPLQGVPVGLKDIIDTADMPTENGCALHKGTHAARRRRGGRDAARRRRGDPRQDGHHRVRLLLARQDAQSAQPRAHARRLLERLGRGGGRRAWCRSRSAARPPARPSGPAAFCGVYGFKPTHGLIPRTGILQLSRTLDHVGLFARTLEDLALLAESRCGLPRGRSRYAAARAHRVPEIAGRGAADPADAGVRQDAALGTRGCGSEGSRSAELRRGARRSGRRGRAVRPAGGRAPGPGTRPSWKPRWPPTSSASGRSGRDKLSEQLRSLIERGREVRAVDYQRALQRTAALVESFDELFTERYDAILTPGGARARRRKAWARPVTRRSARSGRCCGMPALSLPLMQGANGLPLGVQLVGRRELRCAAARTARWLVSQVQQG